MIYIMLAASSYICFDVQGSWLVLEAAVEPKGGEEGVARLNY